MAYQSGSESLSDPTDHAINSAPVVVLREIGKKYAGSRKKTLRPAGTDLVSAGLLDEQSSNELIEVWVNHFQIDNPIKSEKRQRVG